MRWGWHSRTWRGAEGSISEAAGGVIMRYLAAGMITLGALLYLCWSYLPSVYLSISSINPSIHPYIPFSVVHIS